MRDPRLIQIDKILGILDNLRMELMKSRLDEQFKGLHDPLNKAYHDSYVITIDISEIKAKLKQWQDENNN